MGKRRKKYEKHAEATVVPAFCPSCQRSLLQAKKQWAPEDRPDLDFYFGGKCIGRGIRYQRVICKCGQRVKIRTPLTAPKENAGQATPKPAA